LCCTIGSISARQVHRTVEHHAAHRFPIRRRKLGERLVRPDGGIVDQDVNAAEL
jgi:hypothetical protein